MAEQAQTAADSGPRPIVPFLKLQPKPHLMGSKCGATEGFTPITLSDKGKVYVFSVVHQSFPGIKTPYITAIVDLPEGVSVRSNIVDIDAEDAQKNPKQMFDLPVEMVTSVVAKDREGHDVVAFAFKPSKN